MRKWLVEIVRDALREMKGITVSIPELDGMRSSVDNRMNNMATKSQLENALFSLSSQLTRLSNQLAGIPFKDNPLSSSDIRYNQDKEIERLTHALNEERAEHSRTIDTQLHQAAGIENLKNERDRAISRNNSLVALLTLPKGARLVLNPSETAYSIEEEKTNG
jgi:hypothetical protein